MLEPWRTLLIVGISIAAVIVLVLKVRLPAFLGLLIVAVATGIAFGGDPETVLAAVRKGTGEALGFVAVVIGLGAMFGAMLEAGGGVDAIARRLLAFFGEKRSPWALTAVGIIVGIPLFFDVAFIILAPLLCTLAHTAGRRVVYFAIPLLAGLMTMHALLPPHPGPVAVAELLGGDYGTLAFYGLVCGIPAAIIAGPVLAYTLFRQPGWGDYTPPPMLDDDAPQIGSISFTAALIAILVPLGLILLGAVATELPEGFFRTSLEFLGHPFVALIVACLWVWIMGLMKRTPSSVMSTIMGKALEPAGVMTLIVGAGAAYKEVLIQSGAGAQITAAVESAKVSVLVFAFLLSAFVRVAQGSATVAMVTAAGLSAPLVLALGLNPSQIALVTVAIGGGASVCSHVNDTGFWLVKQYLGLTEAQTFRSWTISSTVAGLSIFAMTLILWPFV